MQYQIVAFGIALTCTKALHRQLGHTLQSRTVTRNRQGEREKKRQREQPTTAQRRVPNEVIECKLQNCWRGRKAAKLQLQLQLQVNKLLRLVVAAVVVLGPGPHFQLSHSRTAERDKERESKKERQLSDNESEQLNCPSRCRQFDATKLDLLNWLSLPFPRGRATFSLLAQNCLILKVCWLVVNALKRGTFNINCMRPTSKGEQPKVRLNDIIVYYRMRRGKPIKNYNSLTNIVKS